MKQLTHIRLQTHHECLTFGVAKAHIVFQQMSCAIVTHHQAGKKNAFVVNVFFLHGVQQAVNKMLLNECSQSVADQFIMRKRSHAASVVAAIAIIRALVVLGNAEPQRIFAIQQGKDAQFPAIQTLFNQQRLIMMGKVV